MIAFLRGIIVQASVEKDLLRVIVDVNGVGYDVWMARAAEMRLPLGQTATVLISESVTAFDGATTLYGFTGPEEKDMYTRLRENVDGMGPKKAMETLDRIGASLPDFKRAIIENDLKLLVSVFGFSKKTAEKLVVALKDKMDSWSIAGPSKWQPAPVAGTDSEAVSGLVNLGYDEAAARELVSKAKERIGSEADVEALIKESLRALGGRLA